MTTVAHRIAKLTDDNGQSFPDEFMAALDEHCPYPECPDRSNAYEPVRYEFEDGSAIVIAGDCWDLGVHASRLAEAAERDLHPDADFFGKHRPDPRDVRYAWLGGNDGLHEADANPADGTAQKPGE